jgi:predicted CXXCH cytochrome family protein
VRAILPQRTRVAALAGACLLVLASGWGLADAIARDLGRPLSVRGAPYVGSDACRRCHAEQHASWHRTYHRTMTQEAGTASVLGDFSDATFDYLGVRARMHLGPAGAHLVSFARAGGAERWQARIDRAVGSHRYQQYLARDGDVWVRLPVAWNVEEQRWMHMNGAFLTPDPPEPPAGASVSRADYDRHVTRWNDNCIYCHNVGPNPGLETATGRFDSHVAELGIACEACHGPGGRHVAHNANPVRRYALHLGSGRDPTIAHPGRLSPARGADVCGRCHGQRLAADIGRVHRHGDAFVPGDSLWDHSRPLHRDTTLNGEAGVFAARFWNDGTPRLTAYEYQGLLDSPCHARGRLTCESCHAMHESDPAGQMRRDRGGDAMCTQCHERLDDAAALRAHTRHDPAGPGARCRGCHMPDVVYGLVGGRISHRIESPDPRASALHARPDACTLCHADRSRAWAIAAAGTVGGEPARGSRTAGDPASERPGATGAGAAELPEVGRMLLAGDPIERALAAHALGNTDSPAPVAPRLGLLLDALVADDDPGVRATAWRAVRRIAGAQAGVQAPRATSFTPTGTRAERAAQARAVAAALPAGLVAAPDASVAAALRPLARAVAIEIGE